jgi:outer membrane protein OmpA-like peptidoglycan-associated protein
MALIPAGKTFMKQSLAIILAWGFVLACACGASAVPTPYGGSGLLTQPTAETLNAGNICVGIWTDHAAADSGDSTTLPVSLTLGLGSFLEAYGSYPNLLFNGDEDQSTHGFANIGMKLRLAGRRSAPFKLAVDGQARKIVSDDQSVDGLNSFSTRLIASLKPGRFGIHMNGGIVFNENPSAGLSQFEDQYVLGGGIEFFPTARFRLVIEGETLTEKVKGVSDAVEALAGFQFFISPHLTLNAGGGMGFSDGSPDWRVLVGFSTCQGIGTYMKPIPKIVEPVDLTAEDEVREPVKMIKVKTLTPLISKQPPPISVLMSKLEVPVEPANTEVILTPAERLVVPGNNLPQPMPVAPAVPAGPRTGTADESIRTVVYRKFRLSELTYGYDQWSLSEEGKRTISEVAEQLRSENKWFVIRVDGHTDSIASESYNEKLSLKRAISLGTYLVVHNGFDPSRVFVKGFGEREPISNNATPEGRIANRRVEVLILLPVEEP